MSQSLESLMLAEAINAMATVQRRKEDFLAEFRANEVPPIEEYENWIYENLKTIVERKAGNESGFATTYPTIELRGVETDRPLEDQIQKVAEEEEEQERAYATGTLEELVDETWDVIRSNFTLLEIIAKQTGIPITEGRDRHLAKMDSRGYKERKKEVEALKDEIKSLEIFRPKFEYTKKPETKMNLYGETKTQWYEKDEIGR